MDIDFSKLNTITINEAMAYKIRDWFLAQKGVIPANKENPFSEGVLDLGDMGGTPDNKIYFNLEHAKGFFFSVYAAEMHVMDFVYADEVFTNLTQYNKKVLRYMEKNPIDQTAMSYSMSLVASALAYISLYRNEERFVSSSHTRISQTKKPKKGSNKPRKVYINKKTYVVNEVSDSLTGRSYERHMEAWRVRGHMRIYKSGATRWIKSFVKGDKSKLKDEPSTYVVSDNQNLGGMNNE
ncbi:hypothetical protein IAQ67_29065 (plasmid) [Paenibacillus peoriae]|uniref:Uncharacterized protein n=1 Tax=Paenibacillus peoriae TaxID=59893 RepID=A0A7H0YH48_9BACL|nr:hypothetical protein [Paenibacillus peoriae]QNR70406.1 hypothetical protein IAQ67_29065 [Paenibacillus peoriae]